MEANNKICTVEPNPANTKRDIITWHPTGHIYECIHKEREPDFDVDVDLRPETVVYRIIYQGDGGSLFAKPACEFYLVLLNTAPDKIDLLEEIHDIIPFLPPHDGMIGIQEGNDYTFEASIGESSEDIFESEEEREDFERAQAEVERFHAAMKASLRN